MIFPPLVMARAMISALVSLGLEKDPSAHVHLGAGRPDENAVEAGDGALAHEVSRGIHLQALYGLHADVVVQEKSPLLDNAHGAGPHHHLLRPVVDHRKAQLGVLLDEKLRDADVKTSLEMRRRGAAGDDVELRVFLGDDQVVDILADVFLVQVQTGLHGPDGLGAGQGPDDVSVMEMKLRRRRVLVGIDGDELPVILPGPFVLLEGLLDGDHLEALLPGVGVHHGRVHLDVGPRPAALAGVDPGLDHSQAVLSREASSGPPRNHAGPALP